MNNLQTLIAPKLLEILDIVKPFCSTIEKKADALVIKSNQKELLAINKEKIDIVLPEILKKIFSSPSALKDEDEYLSTELIKNVILALSKKGEITRLNHIGFCYPVASLEKEKEETLSKVAKKDFDVYKMPSNDLSSWWFIGDLANWRDPMLELLPVYGNIDDKEVDYWLPHIHINVDTDLFYEEIKSQCNRILKGTRNINPIAYDGQVVQVRIWLGVISGINMHLDFSTIASNTRYVRKVMLTDLE